MIISGGFVAFTLVRNGISKMRTQELLTDKNDWKIGKWWEGSIKYFIPIAALALLVWWLTLSVTIYAPHRWYDPFSTFSVMSVLSQWFVVLTIFLLLNRWMANNMVRISIKIDD